MKRFLIVSILTASRILNSVYSALTVPEEKVGDIFDCDPKNGWKCFNYNGKLGYNASCMSDGEKKDLFLSSIDPNGFGNTTQDEKKLLEKLDNESCDTTQFLECRETGSTEDHQPLYRCACPDHEKGNAPDAVRKSKAYYDKETKRCVHRVRAKCSGIQIPDASRRLNGSRRFLTKYMKNVVDGRRQWQTLACVKNAHCNVDSTQLPMAGTGRESSRSRHHVPDLPDEAGAGSSIPDESDEDDVYAGGYWHAIVDHTKNHCVCDEAYIAGEDNECHPIDTRELGFYPICGMFMILLSFSFAFWVFICQDDNDLYFEKGYGKY